MDYICAVKAMTHNKFYRFFPSIELPILLSDDLLIDFSRKNKALPPQAIEEFIVPVEKNIDEFTEFIPCFKLPDTELFHAIVYWKGGLLSREFVLVSYDLKDNFICRRSLASMIIEEDIIKKSVAQIEENGIISIVAGQNDQDDAEYDPKNSKVYRLEIQDDGQVIFANKENN